MLTMTACGRLPLPPPFSALARRLPLPRLVRSPKSYPLSSNHKRFATAASSALCRSFSWDDVFRFASDEGSDDASDLSGYFQKVRNCNRGSVLRSEFLPFLVGSEIVGYIHNGFVDHLTKFEDVFAFVRDKNEEYPGSCVTLHPSLTTPEDRTRAVGDVIKCLGGLIPGIRNELYPVTPSFGMPIYFSLERAAAPYFGIKAYGVHMNGYVERDGQKFLWIAKRSDTKPTFPGMLDHLVAGGMPHGISCKENIMKESKEEAGIPISISNRAVPVGAVSYSDIEGHRYKRDVLFCYDLKLPDGFLPENEDGEVDSFQLIPITQVANVIQRTEFFKPNCSLVIIDFFFRHGFMNPDDGGYLELLESLKSRECT